MGMRRCNATRRAAMALTVLVLAFQEASGWRASRFPTVQRPPVAAMMAFDLTPKPVPGERRAAVERILEVELARLRSAFDLNWERLMNASPLQMASSPAPSAEEIIDEMEARRPILRWATTLWLKEALGIDKFGCWCPTLKRFELHPWQWTPKGHPTLETPTLVQSLIALRPALTAEIKRGLRSSPLRVVRLAYRAAFVYVLAALQHLPGPQRGLIQRIWPRIVEHLAATLEMNHRLAVMSAVPRSLNSEVAPVLTRRDISEFMCRVSCLPRRFWPAGVRARSAEREASAVTAPALEAAADTPDGDASDQQRGVRRRAWLAHVRDVLVLPGSRRRSVAPA